MYELEEMTTSMEYADTACPPDVDCSPLNCNPDAHCGPDYDWE